LAAVTAAGPLGYGWTGLAGVIDRGFVGFLGISILRILNLSYHLLEKLRFYELKGGSLTSP
jgi:hypothetical protein